MDKKTVGADHFKDFKMPGQLRAGGGQVAFLVRQANLEENRYDSDIWLYREGQAQQLTSSGRVAKFWWLPDGETIVFVLTNGEKGTILRSIHTGRPGEAIRRLQLEQSVEELVFLDEERFLFTAQSGGPGLPAGAEERDAEDYEVITELPVWEDGGSYQSGKRRRLYYWNGKDVKPPLDDKTDVEALRLAEDGMAYFIANRFEDVAGLGNRLIRLDMESGLQRDLSIGEDFTHIGHMPLPGGQELLVLGTDRKDYGINQNGAFYRVDVGSGEATRLYGAGEYDSWNSIGCDVVMNAAPFWQFYGGKVCWVATVGESAQIMGIDPQSGEISPVTDVEGAVCEMALSGGQLYTIAMRGLGGPELYRLGGGQEERLTDFNTGLGGEYAYVSPEPCSVTNRAGLDIMGWVMKPAGWREGETYPAILYIHGGPKTAYGPVFFHEMQLLAAKGFGVFYCNPTGSDGRGDEFADIRGCYGDIDYDDLMRFTDMVLARHEWINPERLGVTGGSYGGYMTNWIIGHTGRFKAAVSQRCISNWTSMALTSDIGYYFEPDQAATDPWTDSGKLWDVSPLKYANRVRTPTLFIHSMNDYRCPLPEALQMYSALQLHNVETRLCVFRDEHHDLSRSGKPRHRVTRLSEIVAWFEKYLQA